MIGTGIRTEWDSGYVRLDGCECEPDGRPGTMQGLGDFQNALSSMIAGGELNRLISGIFKVQDFLGQLIEARNGILAGYRNAQAIYVASEKFGPLTISIPFGAAIPNPYRLDALSALTAGKKGVEMFARQIVTLSSLSRVFGEITVALTKAGLANDANAVDQTLAQMRRFIKESDDAFAGVPEYSAMKAKINAAASHEWQVWGVAPDATSDPRWFQAFIKAAQMTCPMEGDVWPPEGLSGYDGLAGLGALPVIGAVILWVVGIIATAVTVMYTISKLIDSWNSKAITAEKLILQRDKEKEALRQQMIAAGKSQAEISAATTAFDSETKGQVKDIPESGLGASITTVALFGLAALVGMKVAKVI